MRNNKIFQLIYRAVLLIICFIGILDCFNLLFDTRINLDALVYYTTLSNIFCFVITLLVLINDYKKIKNGIIFGSNNKYVKLKYNASIIILITFIIYNFVLVNNMFSPGWNYIGNLSKHILTPILFILDFLLFDQYSNLKIKDVFASLIIPILYVAFIIIRGLILPSDFPGTIYPYFFLNYKEIGVDGVFKWLLLLTISYFIIALISFVFVKKVLKKPIHN